MKYLVLIYIDESLRDTVPQPEADTMMRNCFRKADAMQAKGEILMSQQLAPVADAKSVRIRDGRITITDGPFAETKEFLAGFNLIEAATPEEALRIAQEFPWAKIGCVEVRPVTDMEAVRVRVGA